MQYKHSEVGSYRGKRVWRFLPRNYKTKKEAKVAGEVQKRRFGYLYRIVKMAAPYRDQLSGGYRLYVFALQAKG